MIAEFLIGGEGGRQGAGGCGGYLPTPFDGLIDGNAMIRGLGVVPHMKPACPLPPGHLPAAYTEGMPAAQASPSAPA